MKTATITAAAVLLISSALTTTASAGSMTIDREARTAKIEALYAAVRSGRMSRSARVQAYNDIARLKAENRKEMRQQDRMRDRQAALNAKH